jgi:hypothetical protein
MNNKLDDVLKRLWEYNSTPRSTQGEAMIYVLENLYKVQLPDDFKTYLIEASPAVAWDDKNNIVFWAPEKITSVKDVWGADFPAKLNDINTNDCLLFADYLDWCGYAYAICCSQGPDRGKVALIGTDKSQDRWIASSFCSFIGLAVENSQRLHSPSGDGYKDIV